MRAATRRGTIGLLATALASCGSARSSDSEQIVDAVAQMLASGRSPICVNNRTDGEALAIWRYAHRAPSATGPRTGWSTPIPLIPSAPTRHEASAGERAALRFAESPASGSALPRARVLGIQAAAQQLSVMSAETPVTVGGGPKVSSRWWLIHRVRGTCPYVYQLSDPAQSGPIAFVAVKVNHWGTVYALEHHPRGWTVVARWAAWLY